MALTVHRRRVLRRTDTAGVDVTVLSVRYPPEATGNAPYAGAGPVGHAQLDQPGVEYGDGNQDRGHRGGVHGSTNENVGA